MIQGSGVVSGGQAKVAEWGFMVVLFLVGLVVEHTASSNFPSEGREARNIKCILLWSGVPVFSWSQVHHPD